VEASGGFLLFELEVDGLLARRAFSVLISPDRVLARFGGALCCDGINCLNKIRNLDHPSSPRKIISLKFRSHVDSARPVRRISREPG
jgi:hypothetical protein